MRKQGNVLKYMYAPNIILKRGEINISCPNYYLYIVRTTRKQGNVLK